MIAIHPARYRMRGVEPFITISNANSREIVSSPRYYHDYTERTTSRVIVQWTRKGYGIYEDADGIRRVEKESAFVIITPDNSRYYYPRGETAPWLIDWVDFTGALAESLFREFKERYGPVVPLSFKGTAGILLSRLISKVEKGELRDRRESSREAYNFILEWWREAAQTEEERHLSSVIEACTGNGANRFMTIKELAAECGLSREHFTRCFVQQTGISPSAWLRRQRLAAAAALLRDNPGLTLATVARETGFATGRHLAASFRRAYGTAVGEYRRANSV